MKKDELLKIFCDYAGCVSVPDFIAAYSSYFEKPVDGMTDSEVLDVLTRIWEFWRRPDLGVPFFQGGEGDSIGDSGDKVGASERVQARKRRGKGEKAS